MEIGVQEFWGFLCVFARVTALFVAAPVFGSRGVPIQAKAGLAALISLVLLPIVTPELGPAPRDLLSLIAQIGAETLVGLSLGYLVVLIFAAIQTAGHFLDAQMGFSIINVLNPYTGHQSSVVEQLLHQLGMTLFLIFGGHLHLTAVLAGSYNLVSPAGAQFQGDLAVAMISIAGGLLVAAFRIAAPVAAILLIVDVAFGIVARTVPQMNVFIVGLPIKIVAGLTTLGLALPAFAIILQDQLLPGLGAAARAVLEAAR